MGGNDAFLCKLNSAVTVYRSYQSIESCIVLQLKMSNSLSGWSIADHSKDAFLELKRTKDHHYVVFKIDEKKKKEVVVEKIGNPAESFDDFWLPYRKVTFDMQSLIMILTSGNCQKSKIFFFAWKKAHG